MAVDETEPVVRMAPGGGGGGGGGVCLKNKIESILVDFEGKEIRRTELNWDSASVRKRFFTPKYAKSSMHFYFANTP